MRGGRQRLWKVMAPTFREMKRSISDPTRATTSAAAHASRGRNAVPGRASRNVREMGSCGESHRRALPTRNACMGSAYVWPRAKGRNAGLTAAEVLAGTVRMDTTAWRVVVQRHVSWTANSFVGLWSAATRARPVSAGADRATTRSPARTTSVEKITSVCSLRTIRHAATGSGARATCAILPLAASPVQPTPLATTATLVPMTCATPRSVAPTRTTIWAVTTEISARIRTSAVKGNASEHWLSAMTALLAVSTHVIRSWGAPARRQTICAMTVSPAQMTRVPGEVASTPSSLSSA